MSTEFKKEDRYVVIKRIDMWCLSAAEKTILETTLDKIRTARGNRGKEDLECVVVEHDWPMYEQTWGLIQAHEELNRKEGPLHPDMGDWLK